jgi:hypothetical protein
MYIKSLHENTDAQGIALYANKYDFSKNEDFSSLIDLSTLRESNLDNSISNDMYIGSF